jgi:hypothetical protein
MVQILPLGDIATSWKSGILSFGVVVMFLSYDIGLELIVLPAISPPEFALEAAKTLEIVHERQIYKCHIGLASERCDLLVVKLISVDLM